MISFTEKIQVKGTPRKSYNTQSNESILFARQTDCISTVGCVTKFLKYLLNSEFP